MINKNTIKYFAYVRKSTEGEERQALSIASQTDKVKEFFANLDIIEILEERYSAFKPYNRPVFKNMIKRINSGEASGIIAWHPDRLSRNEIDASTITYLTRTGIIKDLKFGSYNFDNSPEGIMMLQLSLSQSQYFSSKLGKDVKRGLEQKFKMGWQPNMCPNGYVNIRDNKTGISVNKIDHKRFKILRKAFDLMLSGGYSVPEVLDKLNNDWAFKSKIGNGGLSRSSLYRIFTNIFYAGIIRFDGKQKYGKHKAMITLEEFDRIQFLLGKKGKARKRKHNHSYTGIIKCANCGCMISADKKRKTIKTTGKIAEYTYYCCTHKKKMFNCQEKAIEVKDLEKQIDIELSKYKFQSEFEKLFLKIIEGEKKDTPKEYKIIINNLKERIEKIKIEKSNLTRLSCKALISDDEFTKQKNEYEKEALNIKQKLYEIEKKEKGDNKILDKIEFAIQAKTNFKKGSHKERKIILNEIGSNREISNKKLLITPYKWLVSIEKEIKPLEAQFFTLELDKKPLSKAKNEQLSSLCCEWRCFLIDVRTFFDENPEN